MICPYDDCGLDKPALSGFDATEQPGAEFIGWQDMLDEPPQALYNITGKHYLSGSTVGTDTLKKEGIEIPKTPPAPAWEIQP